MVQNVTIIAGRWQGAKPCLQALFEEKALSPAQPKEAEEVKTGMLLQLPTHVWPCSGPLP